MGRPLPRELRFEDFVEESFLPTRASLELTSQARDLSYLRTHILPVFGALPIASIDYTDCQVWVNDLATRRAAATVVKAAQIMSRVLKMAVCARVMADETCLDLPDHAGQLLAGDLARKKLKHEPNTGTQQRQRSIVIAEQEKEVADGSSTAAAPLGARLVMSVLPDAPPRRSGQGVNAGYLTLVRQRRAPPSGPPQRTYRI